FTAMAILILVDKNLLTLDTKITKFFPNLIYCKPVTIKNLLNHTSGLPDHEKILYQTLKNIPEPNIYDSLNVLENSYVGLDFAVNTKFEYSNSGYVLLAIIIELISGEKYSEFLQKNIFNKLGMKNTFVLDEFKAKVDNRVIGYRKIMNDYKVFDYDPLNYIIGDEGVYSNILDLSKWWQAWQTEILLSKRTLSLALKKPNLLNGSFGRCGCSWFVEEYQNQKIIFHDGIWVGFTNIFLVIPESNIQVILLTNSNDLSNEKLRINAAVNLLKKYKIKF
ncbi:MAG: serine hydrolase domain-containing protein, partial [bacterium]